MMDLIHSNTFGTAVFCVVMLMVTSVFFRAALTDLLNDYVSRGKMRRSEAIAIAATVYLPSLFLCYVAVGAVA